jgi:hypothetical protein
MHSVCSVDHDVRRASHDRTGNRASSVPWIVALQGSRPTVSVIARGDAHSMSVGLVNHGAGRMIRSEPPAMDATLAVRAAGNQRGASIRELLLISTVWAALVAAAGPFVGVPLNDDWVYARSVERLLADGEFRPIPWSQALHLTHALWGAMFSLAWGFDHDVLRVSTLTLALAGGLAAFDILRRAGLSTSVAALSVTVILGNPLYFALSVTYMTDVPFVAVILASSWCYMLYLRNGRGVFWVAATLLAVAATLNRQVGLALPAAFLVAELAHRGYGRRALVFALLPLLLCVASLKSVEHWLRLNDALPTLYSAQATKVIDAALDAQAWQNVVRHGTSVLLYLGMLLFPLIVWMAAYLWRERLSSRFGMALGPTCQPPSQQSPSVFIVHNRG